LATSRTVIFLCNGTSNLKQFIYTFQSFFFLLACLLYITVVYYSISPCTVNFEIFPPTSFFNHSYYFNDSWCVSHYDISNHGKKLYMYFPNTSFVILHPILVLIFIYCMYKSVSRASRASTTLHCHKFCW